VRRAGIDRDVLNYFQVDGPDSQEPINQALRKAAGEVARRMGRATRDPSSIVGQTAMGFAALNPSYGLRAGDSAMTFDNDRIDDAVLALLYLGLHDQYRAWKGFDWEAMNRLHKKGMIDNPKNKNKSVAFTDEGLRRSKELFEAMFARRRA
jgi:hypothetical protein